MIDGAVVHVGVKDIKIFVGSATLHRTAQRCMQQWLRQQQQQQQLIEHDNCCNWLNAAAANAVEISH
jgi:hypothetical protein